MARVQKNDHQKALKILDAHEMVMKDRVMQRFILVQAEAVEHDASLQRWVEMALAYNATLPAFAAKPSPGKPSITSRR